MTDRDFARAAALTLLGLLIGAPARASDRVTAESLTGESAVDPGAADVEVRVLATHDLEIHAFSVALQYAAAPLTLEAASFATTAAAGAEFTHAGIDPEAGTAVLAAIMDYEAPFDGEGIAAAPEEPQVLAVLRFSVAEQAAAGVYPLELPPAVGEPPIGTVFSNQGYTILPERVPGAIEITNPNHLHAPDLMVGPGAAFQAVLTIDHTWPLQGLQTSLVYPNRALALDDITIDGLDINRRLEPTGGTVDFFAPVIEPSIAPGLGWGATGIQIDYPMPRGRYLPPGTGQTVVRYHFRVIGDVRPGDVIPLDLADDYGNPPINNIFIVDGVGHIPILHDGSVEILDLPTFVRGRINPDLVVNIADAIYLINWLFADGPGPTCLDACNVNDDWTVDIADVIYLANYLFSFGTPPPPPFPNCGVDATPDAVECDVPVGCGG